MTRAICIRLGEAAVDDSLLFILEPFRPAHGGSWGMRAVDCCAARILLQVGLSRLAIGISVGRSSHTLACLASVHYRGSE